MVWGFLGCRSVFKHPSEKHPWAQVSFILPAFAYNLYYMRSASRRAMAPKQPPR